jgi:hypothetical protein
MRMAARTAVVAGTATAVSGRVGRRQAAKSAATEQAAAQQPVTQQLAPPPAEDDPMVKLQQLASLHTAGVLSDEEFTAAKAKILGI